MDDIEAIMDRAVLDTTTRARRDATRRDECTAAGVFDRLCAEVLEAFDRVIGLDLDIVALDGLIHNAPCGGEGTGWSRMDRANLSWNWSVAAERHGIPIAWSNDGAMLEPTPGAVAATGLDYDIGTLTLDRSYD